MSDVRDAIFIEHPRPLVLQTHNFTGRVSTREQIIQSLNTLQQEIPCWLP